MSERKDKIIDFIKKTLHDYEFYGAVIGISGGLDSTVVAKLLIEALGQKKVLGLSMPERDSSKKVSEDSRYVCESLGLEYKTINLTKQLRAMGVYSLKPPTFLLTEHYKEKYTKGLWENMENPYIADLKSIGDMENRKNQAYYRAKNRMRMINLYFEAEKRRYAVIGTTNKTEYDLGLYVKWGDESSDIEPILHLYKTEVFDLARELDIPTRILNKAPSPDIAPGVTDEYLLGMDYNTIDRILIKIYNKLDLSVEDKKNVNAVKAILENVKYREIKNLTCLNRGIK
ncbi:MAG: NH(3)-dependent NAD(+) synthetase [Clostridiales bacterium 38_11]|nr:MAG: NH(3)-dependent NAD(+) synthetase [Clostridiales bacterium 38_11]HBH11657.1 NAD(+) synthase [Clostridiales bacterium]